VGWLWFSNRQTLLNGGHGFAHYLLPSYGSSDVSERLNCESFFYVHRGSLYHYPETQWQRTWDCMWNPVVEFPRLVRTKSKLAPGLCRLASEELSGRGFLPNIPHRHVQPWNWQPYSVKYFAFWLLFWTFLLSPHVVTLGGNGKTRIFSVLTHFSKLVNLAGVTAHTVPSVDNVSMAVYVYAGRSKVRRKTRSECVLRLKAGFTGFW
jgi:hypothetical protein